MVVIIAGLMECVSALFVPAARVSAYVHVELQMGGKEIII